MSVNYFFPEPVPRKILRKSKGALFTLAVEESNNFGYLLLPVVMIN